MSDQFAGSVKREVVATICGVGVRLSAEMWVLTGVESVAARHTFTRVPARGPSASEVSY